MFERATILSALIVLAIFSIAGWKYRQIVNRKNQVAIHEYQIR